LPERLSRVSSRTSGTVAFTPSANGHAMNGNGRGHAMNGNGKASKPGKPGKGNGSPAGASLHSWAGSGGKGSTSHPGGWTPNSLSGTGSRFAKK
jgi:hypothetical protein